MLLKQVGIQLTQTSLHNTVKRLITSSKASQDKPLILQFSRIFQQQVPENKSPATKQASQSINKQ
jgi:hypothetical protein